MLVNERIRIMLQEVCQIDPKLPLLVGVSGGPDSLFLLDVLYQLNYNLVVAHLDHQLRAESRVESDYVREIARRLKIPSVIERQDVGFFARKHKISFELAARQVRYKFLFKKAEELGAQAVAVAHTADDQVETVLLHLLRGTGLQGLTGMQYRLLPNPWSQSIPLIRPVLDISRQEVLDYLVEKEYKPHQDLSNKDTGFLRNRIRHNLIPVLEEYNPRLRQNLFQMAEILRQDNLVLQDIEKIEWNQCLREQACNYVGLDLPSFQAAQPAIQRRLMRNAFARLIPDLMDIEFSHIQKAILFLKHPTSNPLQLTSGLQIYVEQDLFYIMTENTRLPDEQWPLISTGTDLAVDLSGRIMVNKDWNLISKFIDNTNKTLKTALSNQDPYTAWLDYDQLTLPLHLRSRLPGDRFQPLGLEKGSQKISDYFINRKLPHRARKNWPLLCMPTGIAWVPGYQIAHPVRVSNKTQKILFMKLVRQ